MTDTLGAGELRRAVRIALAGLQTHRLQIDEANVYPVPDGDTGTNLVMTMQAVSDALDTAPDRPADVARAVTEASLSGAKGNSGVILAQFLRGLCESVDGDGATVERAAAGLKRAAELSYQAMARPREGTMLTVARAAADAAQAAANLVELFETATVAARDALEHTPDLLPELRASGVVDAGGIGLVIVLEALAATMSDREAEPVRVSLPGARPVMPRESGSIEFAYEVQYLLDAADDAIPVLRSVLSAIGDSVAVVGGGGRLNVHVHTNNVGQAIEAGIEHGRPHAISVVAFEDQIAETRGLQVAVSASPVGVLAVADGEGFRMVFEDLGARAVAPGDEEAVLRGIAAPEVVVLVCATSVTPFDPGPGRTAEILEAGDPARGIAAMLAFTDSSDFLDNVAAMRAALAAARTAAAEDPGGVVASVKALGGGEALTVFTGAGVPDWEREGAAALLREALPDLGIEVREGGQASARYLFVLE